VPSPADIASVGHTGAQTPQLMQSSLITYAIVVTSLFILIFIFIFYIKFSALSTLNVEFFEFLFEKYKTLLGRWFYAPTAGIMPQGLPRFP